MVVQKLAIILLILTYLSGTFTLERIGISDLFPIRYLLMSTLIMWLSYIYINFRKKNHETKILNLNKIIYTYFIYAIAISISMFYTPDTSIALEKYELILFLFILIIINILFLSLINIPQFFLVASYTFISIGAIYSLPVLIDILLGESRGDVGFSGPNVATRIFFFAICSSLYLYDNSRKNIFIILALLFSSNIVLVGSRGGLLSALLIFMILLLVKNLNFKWRFKKNRKFSVRIFAAIPILLILAYALFEPIKRVLNERFIQVTFQASDTVYTSGRDVLYSKALNMIRENPILGNGLQSFTYRTGEVYPHNLLLEMAVEIGLVGIIIFAVFLFMSFKVIFKLKNEQLVYFSGIPLYMIFVQMFSGEFYDFRYYFFWIIPLWYMAKASKT